MNAYTSAPFPASMAACLREKCSLRGIEASWDIEPIASTHSVYRVGDGDTSWIVKQSKTPEKEAVVADLCEAWSIPGMKVQALTDRWVAMEDLGNCTLDTFLGKTAPTRAIVEDLGRIAAQAELLGMRDRNLANLLIVQDVFPGQPTLIQIDYEGAFNAGLLDRLVRPQRLFIYLVIRLFLDVHEKTLEKHPNFNWPDSWRGVFQQAACEEHVRLQVNVNTIPQTCYALSYGQRAIFYTRCRHLKRFKTMLTKAHQHAEKKAARIRGPRISHHD